MIITNPKKYFLVIASLTLFLTNCRKDVSLPNPEMQKLFGNWEWLSSSGGYTGNTIMTPATEGYSKTIEFNENGIYKWYRDGKKEDKMKYTLSEGAGIHSNTTTVYLIKYEVAGFFDKADPQTMQSVDFRGDTLILNDQCYDCFGHVYVRKK